MEFFKRSDPIILTAVGIISTSVLAYLSISTDKEISFSGNPKRVPTTMIGQDSFHNFLTDNLKNQPQGDFCQSPTKYFQKLSLANAPLQSLPSSEFWGQKLPSMEQEAFRRCQSRDTGPAKLVCLSWSSHTPDQEGSFLSSKELMIELYINFHNPNTLEIISCEQANEMKNSLLTAYYTLYWVEAASSANPNERFQRFTNGLAIAPQSSHHESY